MDPRFEAWLRNHTLSQATISTALSDVRRIESAYGDLDAHFELDGLEGVLSELEYTAIDERNGEPNPSKLSIGANLRNNLASYKSHLKQYLRFLQLGEESVGGQDAAVGEPMTFGLEKDLQTALRSNIEQLEKGLRVIDDGREMLVSTGRIDILAEDRTEREVVIELKAVEAPPSCLAQTLGYMSDRMNSGSEVRGMIVAPSHHPRLIAATRLVPSIQLKTYHYRFDFDDVE